MDEGTTGKSRPVKGKSRAVWAQVRLFSVTGPPWAVCYRTNRWAIRHHQTEQHSEHNNLVDRQDFMCPNEYANGPILSLSLIYLPVSQLGRARWHTKYSLNINNPLHNFFKFEYIYIYIYSKFPKKIKNKYNLCQNCTASTAMWSRKWHNLPSQSLMGAEWSGSITALLSNLDNILLLVLELSAGENTFTVVNFFLQF